MHAGTHEIQKVAVITDNQTGHLNISCHFAVGSSALGCFMIALYMDEDTPPLYRTAYRLPDFSTDTLKLNATGLKLLSFHELEVGNIPSRFSAHTEIISVSSDSVPQGNYVACNRIYNYNGSVSVLLLPMYRHNSQRAIHEYHNNEADMYNI